jgi:hypothetical protein
MLLKDQLDQDLTHRHVQLMDMDLSRNPLLVSYLQEQPLLFLLVMPFDRYSFIFLYLVFSKF